MWDAMLKEEDDDEVEEDEEIEEEYERDPERSLEWKAIYDKGAAKNQDNCETSANKPENKHVSNDGNIDRERTGFVEDIGDFFARKGSHKPGSSSWRSIRFERVQSRDELSPEMKLKRNRLRKEALKILNNPGRRFTDSIRQAFLIMEDAGFHPSRVMYNLALKHLGQAGDLSRCMMLYERMKRNRIRPDAYTYGSLLNACAVAKDYRTALELQAEMTSQNAPHNIIIYNSLLKVFKEGGRIDLMEETFKRMCNDEEVALDVRSYSYMMEGYGKTGRVNKTIEVFDMIPEPDVYNCCALLQALGLAGNADEAIKFLRSMPERGVEPNINCFNTVLQIIARKQDSQRAVEFYVDILTSGDVKPNDVTFNTLVDMFAKAGDLVHAMEVVRTMKEEKVNINAITYTSLLNACAEALEPGLAETIFFQLQESGIVVDKYIASAFVKALVKSGQRRKAEKVLERSSVRNLTMYNIIIDSYAREARVGKVIRLLEAARKEGLRPDEVTYSSVVHCCALAKDGLTAKRYIEEIFDQRMKPSLHVLMSAMLAYLLDGRVDASREGKKIIAHMLSRGIIDDQLEPVLKRIWLVDRKFEVGKRKVLSRLRQSEQRGERMSSNAWRARRSART